MQRIRASGDILASTRAVADVAETALVVRVGVHREVGALTQGTSNIACLAGFATDVVTAVSINAEAGVALLVIRACGAVDLLGSTGAADAVRVRAAV